MTTTDRSPSRTADAQPRKLTVGQVAALFGVTVPTVRRWADEGKLHPTRTLGGDRRFDAAEIDRKLAES